MPVPIPSQEVFALAPLLSYHSCEDSVRIRGSNCCFLVQISESNLICLSQIWVKKYLKKRVFATKVRIWSINAWRRRKGAQSLTHLILQKTMHWAIPFHWRKTVSGIFSFKLTFCKWLGCLPKVCYLKLKIIRHLSKLR